MEDAIKLNLPINTIKVILKSLIDALQLGCVHLPDSPLKNIICGLASLLEVIYNHLPT